MLCSSAYFLHSSSPANLLLAYGDSGLVDESSVHGPSWLPYTADDDEKTTVLTPLRRQLSKRICVPMVLMWWQSSGFLIDWVTDIKAARWKTASWRRVALRTLKVLLMSAYRMVILLIMLDKLFKEPVEKLSKMVTRAP